LKPRQPAEPDDEQSFSINFADGRRYDIDAVRRSKEAFMPDGEHAWVISVIHGIDDPDQSLELMTLDGDSFVGVTAIHCLLCTEKYAPSIRHHKCPQQPTPDAARISE
jgi:hypothetical protein